MAVDPRERLAELLREVGRCQHAIGDCVLSGYVTLADEHRAKLREVHDRVRRHCEKHGLELPREVPKR